MTDCQVINISECVFNTIRNSRGRMWWHMPVIPATEEVDVGGMQLEADLGKSVRPYVKFKRTAKGQGLWLK
jgi:hypothetical protein